MRTEVNDHFENCTDFHAFMRDLGPSCMVTMAWTSDPVSGEYKDGEKFNLEMRPGRNDSSGS